MEEITNRIKEIIESKGLSNGAFADLIEIKRPIISHVLSGRNKPSLHVVLQILKSFPEIDATWLLMGTKSQSALERIEAPVQPVQNRLFEEELASTPESSTQATEENGNIPSTLLLIEGDTFRIVKNVKG